MVDPKKLWRDRFGNKNKVRDFAGRWMVFDDHESNPNANYSTMWNIDHLLPKDRGGTDKITNLEIVNVQTNEEKANRTSFVSENGRTYQVQRYSGKGQPKVQAIFDISDDLDEIKVVSNNILSIKE